MAQHQASHVSWRRAPRASLYIHLGTEVHYLRNGLTLTQIKTQVAILMGGRVAERIIFDELSTGAQNDLERATKLANNAVTRFGMSDLIGPRTLASDGEVFLGRDYGKVQNYSDHTGKLADDEIDRMTREGESLAITILNQNRHILDKLAQS